MKNMSRYATSGKISQVTKKQQNVDALVASFQKEFPDISEWHQTLIAEIDARLAARK